MTYFDYLVLEESQIYFAVRTCKNYCNNVTCHINYCNHSLKKKK